MASSHHSPIYYGDFFGPKRMSHMRLVGLNLNNLPIARDDAKEVALFQAILEYEIDVLLLQELGLFWSNLPRFLQWRSRVEK